MKFAVLSSVIVEFLKRILDDLSILRRKLEQDREWSTIGE